MINGYNGNASLKRSGEKISFTQEQIEEYIKCANDPMYFAEKYIKIVHVDHGLIPIVLYDYQKDMMKAIQSNRQVVCNFSRQCGKTTAATCIILHYIIFNSYKTVALLANKADAAREILSRIQLAYEALPKWLQHGVVEWNKGSVELENGCKVIAAATSGSAIRGKSISFLYIDETAHIENWDEFYSSVYPTISSGQSTKVLFTSTPYGLNHFYKFCIEAKEGGDQTLLTPGKNGFVYIEVPWHKVPGRDAAWHKVTLAGLNNDLQKFEQEFNVEFQGSSGTLISGATLKSLTHKNPISGDVFFSVYERPIKGKTYVLIADVSRGKGLDFSAFHVIDVSQMPYNQVAVFHSNLISTADYAEYIFKISTQYNDALILVESNDIGAEVANTLHDDYESENILYTENSGRNGKRIASGFGSSSEKGIRTTKTVKAVGCSMIKMLIEQQQFVVNDFSTIEELSHFTKKGASYEAEASYHDDLVMGLVLFGWLSTQPFFKEITDINTLMRLKEKTSQEIDDNMTTLGFYNMDEIDDIVEIELGGVKDSFMPIGW